MTLIYLFPPPPPPPPPNTSSYLHLSVHPTSSYLLLPSFISSFLLLLLPNTFYFFLHPFTSSYLLLSPITSWFGMVWYGGWCKTLTLAFNPSFETLNLKTPQSPITFMRIVLGAFSKLRRCFDPFIRSNIDPSS